VIFILQIVTAGVATGSVYALIALGIVLIYKCSGVVNFAQGGYAMLGAYFTYALCRGGLSPPIAIVASMVVMAGVGAATELVILRRMLKAPVVAVMMVTLGILIFFRAACLAVWGPDQLAFPQVFPPGALQVAGIFITYNYVAAAALSLVLSLAFLAFYRFTPIGLMQRCAADNGRAALAVGIHVNNQVSLAWAVSSALAGLGGSLLATLNSVSVGLSSIGLVAFPVIVLGGLTSLMGSLVAGLLLGILEGVTDGLLTPLVESFLRAHTSIYSVGALQQVVPYLLVGVMLLLRPQGIFGQRGTERV
jgi:branched-chain amino acid transport system permease protein